MESHPRRRPTGSWSTRSRSCSIAADLAGFSLGEADILRKAMGKKDRELMAQQREKFVSGCKANKIEAKKAERIWDLIEKFAGYGFNKCLTAETRIEMADGRHKAITEIRAGDLVLTKDGPYRARAVRPSGVRPVGRLHLANGMSVRCTPDHPIFTQRGWVNAEDLAPLRPRRGPAPPRPARERGPGAGRGLRVRRSARA